MAPAARVAWSFLVSPFGGAGSEAETMRTLVFSGSVRQRQRLRMSLCSRGPRAERETRGGRGESEVKSESIEQAGKAEAVAGGQGWPCLPWQPS